jgi:hypothetical protein
MDHPMKQYMTPKSFNRYLKDTVVNGIMERGLNTVEDMKQAHAELGALIESIEANPVVKRTRRTKAEMAAGTE